jgi:predicted ATPase
MQNWSLQEDRTDQQRCKWLAANKIQLAVCAVMFVIQHYFKSAKSGFVQGSIQGVFLLGTAGIGKRVFLDYVVHKYLQDGKTVLHLHGPDETAYIFRPDSAAMRHMHTRKSWQKGSMKVLYCSLRKEPGEKVFKLLFPNLCKKSLCQQTI